MVLCSNGAYHVSNFYFPVLIEMKILQSTFHLIIVYIYCTETVFQLVLLWAGKLLSFDFDNNVFSKWIKIKKDSISGSSNFYFRAALLDLHWSSSGICYNAGQWRRK